MYVHSGPENEELGLANAERSKCTFKLYLRALQLVDESRLSLPLES